VKIWFFLIGIVEFFSINLVITPPAVSIPNERGVTSNNNNLSNFSSVSLLRTAAYTAAP